MAKSNGITPGPFPESEYDRAGIPVTEQIVENCDLYRNNKVIPVSEDEQVNEVNKFLNYLMPARQNRAR